MKLATTTGDFLPWGCSPADAVRLYDGTGFRHLDYNFYRVIRPGSPFLGDRWLDEVEAAGREAARLGMDFVQAHSPNYNPLDPKADHETGMLATLRSIEACGRLGIPNIVVHPGIAADLDYPDGREEYFRRNLVFFQSLFPAMETWNVNVLVENSAEQNMGGRYFLMTGEEMRAFADLAGHPLLHCNWDTGHANMRGPLVLARALRTGATRREILDESTVNGLDCAVSLAPLAADSVQPCWRNARRSFPTTPSLKSRRKKKALGQDSLIKGRTTFGHTLRVVELTLGEEFARMEAAFGPSAEQTGPRTLRISLAPDEPAFYRLSK